MKPDKYLNDAVKMWELILKYVESEDQKNPIMRLYKIKSLALIGTEYENKYAHDCSYCQFTIDSCKELGIDDTRKCRLCFGVKNGIFPDTVDFVPCVYSFIDKTKRNSFKDALSCMRNHESTHEDRVNAIKLVVEDFKNVKEKVLTK